MNLAATTLTATDDLDEICRFLAAAPGIFGALVLDESGLPWGSSEGPQSFMDKSPWIVEQIRLAREFAERTEAPAPDELLLLDPESFWHCTVVHGKFYVVVAGKRGSFELFKGRIDRSVQVAEQALKEWRDRAP